MSTISHLIILGLGAWAGSRLLRPSKEFDPDPRSWPRNDEHGLVIDEDEDEEDIDEDVWVRLDGQWLGKLLTDGDGTWTAKTWDNEGNLIMGPTGSKDDVVAWLTARSR